MVDQVLHEFVADTSFGRCISCGLYIYQGNHSNYPPPSPSNVALVQSDADRLGRVVGSSPESTCIGVYVDGKEFILKIELPCGQTAEFKVNLPENSVPCPCGNPKHWLVLYAKDKDKLR